MDTLLPLQHEIWRFGNLLEHALQGTYTIRILERFWDLLSQLWYFALLGAAISSLVWRFLPKEKAARLLKRRVNGSIVAASLLGMISPMCTFAAIPVVGALLARGVPVGPLMAFTVASPLINPSLFVYTAGITGMEMAVARLVTAGVMGLAAGFAAEALWHRGLLRFSPTLEMTQPPGYRAVAGGSRATTGMELTMLARRFRSDAVFVSRYFILGIFIAALASTFLSQELVTRIVGAGSVWAVPVAVALGVPLYACGGGRLPIVEIMMQMGMTPGAALAFFIAGPATKFSTLSVFGAVLGRRSLGFYLMVMLAGAMLWGYVYPFSGDYLQVYQGGATYEQLAGN